MMREYKKYEEYNDSGFEWIGDIPKDWSLSKMKFHCNVFAGGTPSREVEHYWNGNIPWIKSGKIQNDLIKTESEFITKSGLIESSTKIIKKNTSLLAMTGATCGNVGYLLFDSAANQSVMAFESNSDTISKFVYYYLISQKRQIDMIKSGSAQDGLNVTEGKNILFILPSIQEQQKIVSFLDQKTAKIDEIINKKEKLIDHLEKYKKSVITEAVTKGKLGDKYINENGELVDEIEMKDSGVEWIGDIPRYLDLIKLKLDFEVNSGDYLSNNEKSKGKFPMYGGNGFNEYINQYNVDFRTVIIGRVGALCGNVHIVEDKSWITDNSLYLKQISNNFTIDFIYYYLKSLRLNRFATKTAQPLITATLVKNMKIANLNIKSQNRIVNYLNKKTNQINNLIQKTKKSIEKYKEYKESLIFEAVTGKIDLRDHELEGGEELAEHNNSSETERECLSAVD